MVCIWSSWCHCHCIISCSSKIQNDLPFWCRLTQVVLEKRLLNGRISSSSIFQQYFLPKTSSIYHTLETSDQELNMYISVNVTNITPKLDRAAIIINKLSAYIIQLLSKNIVFTSISWCWQICTMCCITANMLQTKVDTQCDITATKLSHIVVTTVVKVVNFNIPYLHLAPLFGVTPFAFCLELRRKKTGLFIVWHCLHVL